jgi:hypothetical protein
MSIERRRSPRMEILGRLHGHVVSLDAPVVVREMSLGGMSLETHFPFPEGAIHEFRLTMGDDSTTLLRARIVRCREVAAADGSKAYISGVQFVEDEAPSDSAISTLIDKIK